MADEIISTKTDEIGTSGRQTGSKCRARSPVLRITVISYRAPGFTSLITAYPELARYPIVTVTSLPLSAPAAREAAPLFVEISRKPLLPRIANSSPGAPSA